MIYIYLINSLLYYNCVNELNKLIGAMKTFKFFALVGIFLATSLPSVGFGHYAQPNSGQSANYVVIGAFSYQKNALKFTKHAKALEMDAQFQMNANRNLYYVYVLDTEDREMAIQAARGLRDNSEFKDTWVYSGILGKMEAGISHSGVDINPDSEQSLTTIRVEDTPVVIERASAETVLEEIMESPATSDQSAEFDDGEAGTSFLFKIYRAIDRNQIAGDVDVIDIDRSRKMGTFTGNTPVRITTPKSTSGKISLVCEVFGYRKTQQDINYDNPETELVQKDENNNVVVPFELARLQKGDIAVMYNVYFFKDAAVMRPESRFEVNSLLEMLKENEKYKIKIHGHTNGGATGKIISMEKDSENFFSLSNTKDGMGSAKKLSGERADVIKEYLIANGITEKRMEIKAWGGKRPLHDKHATRAQENVRVEIEILEDK